MQKSITDIIDFWRKEYSSKINNYQPYQYKDQLRFFASLFSPGDTYFYILNTHNLQLDFVSESIFNVLGLKAEDATIEKLLSMAIPEDIELLEKKELVIKDFFLNYLSTGEERLDYKGMYTYRIRNFNNNIMTMLNQVTVLSVDEHGIPIHAISVHTNIAHIQQLSLSNISFMNLSGGKSFYNIDVSNGVYAPEIKAKCVINLLELLTKREVEIVKLLAQGLSSDQISNKIHISSHTVRTHRKNINSKTGVSNVAELSVMAIMSGLL